MSVRGALIVQQVVGYSGLLLACALAALNVAFASRRAIHGGGPRPIPLLITVLGVLSLRTLSLAEHRPALSGFWPLLTVVVVDFGSWLLPPLVCRWRGLTREAPKTPQSPAQARPRAEPRPAAQPPQTFQPPTPGGRSPFARNPPRPQGPPPGHGPPH